MHIDDLRRTELEKYTRTYRDQPYRMSRSRERHYAEDIAGVEARDGYLDVGCGHGVMLDRARALGYRKIRGTDIVPALVKRHVVQAWAHDLPFPDKSFDVVTMHDVIEHLVPGDDHLACLELQRVARRHIFVGANANSSKNLAGEELHINRRPYDVWDQLFRTWFTDATVTWIKRPSKSEAWRIDLP